MLSLKVVFVLFKTTQHISLTNICRYMINLQKVPEGASLESDLVNDENKGSLNCFGSLPPLPSSLVAFGSFTLISLLEKTLSLRLPSSLAWIRVKLSLTPPSSSGGAMNHSRAVQKEVIENSNKPKSILSMEDWKVLLISFRLSP